MKTLENKGKSQKSTKSLLAKDTYNFSQKLANNQVRECIYDVEFIILKDLRDKHSLFSSDEYKNFNEDEINNLKHNLLAKSDRKPLDRVFMIESDKDIKYVSEIIKDYMELLFIK